MSQERYPRFELTCAAALAALALGLWMHSPLQLSQRQPGHFLLFKGWAAFFLGLGPMAAGVAFFGLSREWWSNKSPLAQGLMLTAIGSVMLAFVSAVRIGNVRVACWSSQRAAQTWRHYYLR